MSEPRGISRQSWKQLLHRGKMALRSRSEPNFEEYVQSLLRQSLDEIASSYRFSCFDKAEDVQLDSGEDEIDLGSLTPDLKYIVSLRSYTLKRRIRRVAFRTIDDAVLVAGIPDRYSRWGSTLIFDRQPAEDELFKLRFKINIKDPIFSDDHYPETPSQWDDIILYRAIRKGFMELFDVERAEFYKQAEIGLLAETPNEEVVEEEDGQPSLQPRDI